MGAEGFLYKEFADDLSSQAKAVLPPDLSQEEKVIIPSKAPDIAWISVMEEMISLEGSE